MKKGAKCCLCLFFVFGMLTHARSQATNKLDLTGDVGIGTVSPVSKLEVRSGYITVSDHSTNRLYLSADAIGGYLQTNNTPLRFYTGSTEKMRLLHNGSFGIGTTTPGSMLAVSSSVARISNFGTSASSGYLEIGASGSYMYVGLGASLLSGASTSDGILRSDNALAFLSNGDNERMRILSNGNIGIGTNDPTSKLEVVNGYFTVSNHAINRLYLSSDAGGAYLQTSGAPLRFFTGSTVRLQILETGNVGIGTLTPSEKLAVNGNIRAKKIIVETGWSDYVFADDYKLKSLNELASFIKQHKHLPDVPSAKEVEKSGISVGENQALLLKKIEELTLYIIEMKKINDSQEKKIESIAAQLNELKNK